MATTQGSSWQLAVAIPIKNHTFEFGQNYVCVLQNGIGANSQYLQIDMNMYPDVDCYLQYRNQILLGPSSHPDNKGVMEHVTVSGSRPYFLSDYNRLYLLNKNNQYKFEAGDRITFYGTGLAAGWESPILSSWNGVKRYFAPQGIQKGMISTQLWATFVNNPPLNEGNYYAYYPAAGAYIKMRRKNSDHSFFIDLDSVYGSKIEYIMDPIYLEDGKYFSRIAMQNQAYTSSFQALLGDYHKGGWRKQYAQRMSIYIDNETPQGFFLKQELTRSGPEGIRDRSLLIPYQYYRIGGRAYVDSTFCSSKVGYDNYYIALALRPLANTRDVSGFEHIGVTVANLTTHNNTWIDFSNIGLLKSGISKSQAPSLEFWFGNDGIVANNAGDLVFYIDDVYVEHAGGVQYANLDGCLDFGRYQVWPDEDSLTIEKVERIGNTSLYGKRDRYVITCRLNYVSQAFWDQFEIIQEWQEKGYLLNLHPYLNDIPHSLMGKVYVKEYAKDNWDLDLRSFTMEFIEE